MKNKWWWVNPPQKVGPLLIVLVSLGFVAGGYFAFTGMFQAAMLVGLIMIIFLLTGLVDLVGELARLSSMILEQLQKNHRVDGK